MNKQNRLGANLGWRSFMLNRQTMGQKTEKISHISLSYDFMNKPLSPKTPSLISPLWSVDDVI